MSEPDSLPTSCPQCGHALAPGHKFCPNCGAPAAPPAEPTFCMFCGVTLAADAQVCTACGTPVGQVAPPEGLPLAAGEVAAASMPVPAPVPASAPAPRRRLGLVPVLGGVLALLILAGGAGWWFFLHPYVGDVTIGHGDVHASDIVTGNVRVVHPRAKVAITARWLHEGTELGKQTFTFDKYTKEQSVAPELKPENPLAPGDYSLEVTLGNGKPMVQPFQVKADLPVALEGATVANEGQSRSNGAISSASTSITVKGTLRNANRFTKLRVEWRAGGSTVNQEQFTPSPADLAAGTVPFSSVMRATPFKPGSYSVMVYDGSNLVGEQSFDVYADVRVSNVQIGVEVNALRMVVQPVTTLSRPYQMWVSFRVDSAPAGTTFEVEWWRNGNRERLTGGEQIWTTSTALAASYQAKGIQRSPTLATGAWQIIIRANGQEAGRATVNIN